MLGHVGETFRADGTTVPRTRTTRSARTNGASSPSARGRRVARSPGTRSLPSIPPRPWAWMSSSGRTSASNCSDARSSAAVSASLAAGTVRAALTSNSASARSAPGPRSSRSASRTRSASSAQQQSAPGRLDCFHLAADLRAQASAFRRQTDRREDGGPRRRVVESGGLVLHNRNDAACDRHRRGDPSVRRLGERAAKVVQGRTTGVDREPNLVLPGRRAGHGGRHAASGPSARTRPLARRATPARRTSLRR